MQRISKRVQILIVAGCFLSGFAIASIDYMTGEKSNAFILYFLPILAATWFGGLNVGLVMALFSASGWLFSDLLITARPSEGVEIWDTVMRLGCFLLLAAAAYRIKLDFEKQKETNVKLTEALTQIKQLTGILPMCSFCRRIRDEDNNWVQFEAYIAQHSEAQVSHGLCPRCYKKHFGQENGT